MMGEEDQASTNAPRDDAALASNAPGVTKAASDSEVVEEVYGKMEPDEPLIGDQPLRKTSFAPWHHPVKQLVRDRQWVKHTLELLQGQGGITDVLRYFTLPGDDLLDVRVLAEACQSQNIRIEYFGFNSSEGTEHAESNSTPPWFLAESEMRQADRITPSAVILSDPVEDVAEAGSHAEGQLRQRQGFDVINLDPCNHLAYVPPHRTRNVFDALKVLLRHQLGMRTPWLLFLTTRVDPDKLGAPGMEFINAVNENVRWGKETFLDALAQCVGVKPARVGSDLSGIWNGPLDERFRKLYILGLTKYLLRYFCAQPNTPANVELLSALAYRVNDDEPDMLALAFKITPEQIRAFEPGQIAIAKDLEPERAANAARRLGRIDDLDHLLEKVERIREMAIAQTLVLLGSCNYDLRAYRKWISEHPRRPVSIPANLSQIA